MPIRPTLALVAPGSELILYLVFLPFGALFFWGLYLRYRASGLPRLMRGAQGGVAGALRRLLAYGLFQRRVAARVRGWPHLGIFFGFLVLLFGTTVVAIDWDLVRPFGARLLAGRPYLYLEALLDTFGVIFVVALVAALAWRLARLPASGADQRRVQWQFVALIVGLLYLGVTGFVLEGLRLGLRPVPWAEWSFAGNVVAQWLGVTGPDAGRETAYRVLWWSHAVVAFALIASLPYSAFLHAIGAPLNVMAQTGRPQLALDAPFDLRELEASGNFDVKVGAPTLADFAPRQRLALAACTNCGRCDDACPAYAAGTALSPRRLVQSLRGRQLAGDSGADLLDSETVSAEAVWACTTCAACVEACPVFIRPVDYIVPLRRELVTRQRIDKRQGEFLGNLGRSLNPYGLPPANRARLAAELETAQAGPPGGAQA